MANDTCSMCAKNITRQTSSVQCTECKKLFHSACLQIPNIPDVSRFPGFSWRCEKCRSKSEGESCVIDEIRSKLNIIQDDIKQIKVKQESVVESVEFYGGKIDDFGRKLQEFEQKIKTFTKVEAKVNENSADISQLKKLMNNLEQQTRFNNLEVNGIPEYRNENLQNIIVNLFNALGVDASSGIVSYHRVPHMNANNQNSKSIIISLSSRTIKDSVLSAIRKIKGITADKIGFGSDNSKIYINDHLSRQNQALFKKTRDECRKRNINCWTRDCKIFARHPGTAKISHIIDETKLHTFISTLN